MSPWYFICRCIYEVKWSEVPQSCPTFCDPMDSSLPCSSIHGIFQARALEWVAISFSRGSSSQGSNPGIPHFRQMLYHLHHQGSQIYMCVCVCVCIFQMIYSCSIYWCLLHLKKIKCKLLPSCPLEIFLCKNRFLSNPPSKRSTKRSSQFSSVAQSCPTLCDLLNHSPPGLPVQHQLPEFTKTHVHRVSDAIQPSYPLTSPSLPARNPSQHQGLFQWVNSSHEVAKLLTFQLYHQSFKWTPRPDPFRMDWLDLLAVQRTLKSLLQHHSAKASILWCPAFFTI